MSPKRVNNNPRLDFGRGIYFCHILGDFYELVTMSGAHLQYIKAEAIEYAPSLEAELRKSRSTQE